MKQFIVLIAAVLTLAACKSGKNADAEATDTKLASGKVTINGEIAGMNAGMLELFLTAGDVQKADSVEVKGGKFTYSKELSEPVQVAIRVVGESDKEVVFFADPGEVTIKGSKDSLQASVIKGGKTQQLFKQAEDSIKTIMAAGNALYQQYVQAQTNQDAASMERIQGEFLKIQDQAKQFATRFSLSNRHSILAPFLGIMYLSEEGGDLALKQVYDTLTPAVKASYFGKKMGEVVTAAQSTSVGAIAPVFTQPDVNGKPVSLADFKGKYLLVDFWASWCGPCRQENPNVVIAYNKYKNKGFDVLGVSLDQKKESWLEAIEKDKLTWTHVSDLKYWDNAAAKLYGVQAIPASYLLDKEGKIIGKNLRGEELEAKLAELFK